MEGNVRKKTKFIKAFDKASGIVSYACEMAGISRRTYYNWLEKDEDFKTQIDQINDRVIDVVENKLLTQINENNLTAIIFYLKTKGKKRGYVETVEQNLTGNPFMELMKALPNQDKVEDDQ